MSTRSVEPVLTGRWRARADSSSRRSNFAITGTRAAAPGEVKARKEELIRKTMAAVKDRLTKEINYWDHRAAQLQAGRKRPARRLSLNSAGPASAPTSCRRSCSERMEELEQERQISALPPVVIGGVLVIPAGLLAKLRGESDETLDAFARETRRIERAAMEAVMAGERALGFVPA